VARQLAFHRVRAGWRVLAGHVLVAAGWALFVAVIQGGRAAPGSLSREWLLAFGLALLGTLLAHGLVALGLAYAGDGALGPPLGSTLKAAVPLLVPAGFALAAYASDAFNHVLTQTSDLAWVWQGAVTAWVAAEIAVALLSLDGVPMRGRSWLRGLWAHGRTLSEPRLTLPLVVALFVSVRVLLAFLWQPFGFFERGSDFGAYEQRARLAVQGLQPFIDYWVEYPPLFPWMASGVKLLSLRFGGSEAAFGVIMSLILLAFETGTLVLTYRIAARVWDEARGLASAVAYAGLFYPLYVANRHFETMAVFFLLLGLYSIMQGRRYAAAAALTLGVLTKAFPIAAFPALLAGAGWGRRARYLAVSAALAAAILVPLAVRGGEFFVASVQNMALRPGWETLWALFDGNTSFGDVHRYRLSPETATQFPTTSHTPLGVSILAGAALVAFAAGLAWRRAPAHPAAAVWMTGAALAAFALWLKGWSPQFMTWFLPLVVIAYPGGRGFLVATGLTCLALLENPGYFVLWSDRAWVLWAIVSARSAAIAGLGVMFWLRLGRLRPATGAEPA